MEKEKKYSVYKLTSPDGKIYIGCTGDDPVVRWKKGYPHNPGLNKDIADIGFDNFDRDVVATDMTMDDAYELEKELIHKFQSNNSEYGYNRSIGGKINSGMVRTDEYRKALSERASGERHPMYGKHHSEESKRKMSESTRGPNHPMYGKHMSESTKQKLRESHKRENLSEETLRKMREARLGKRLSEETRQKLGESHYRKVRCVETGIIYDSVKHAAEINKSHISNISAVCKGRMKTAAGYHWTYVD